MWAVSTCIRRKLHSLMHEMCAKLKMIWNTTTHRPCIHSDTWHPSWVYTFSSHKFSNPNVSYWRNLFDTCPYWHVSRRLTSLVTRVQFKTYCTVHISSDTCRTWEVWYCAKFHVARVTLYKISCDRCHAVQSFLWLVCDPLTKNCFNTYQNSPLSYSRNLILTPVWIYRWVIVQNFCWHVRK